MMFIKVLLLVLTLLLPFCVGALLSDGFDSYLLGQCCLWAVFQIMAVPMIWLKLPFFVLFLSFLIVAAGLAGWGIWKLYHRRTRWKLSLPKSPVVWILLILVIGLVVFQASRYALGMHLDEDDARWIAEANDAVVQNAMYLHNPATGEYIGRPVGELLKDIYSPWSMYIAFLSYVTGFRPAVMAHTIYAPVLLVVSYLAYARIGRHLFSRQEDRLVFVLAAAVIMMFFSGGYTGSVFALIRIWQGKAATAAVMIPAVMSQFLVIQKENTRKSWLILAVICCSACLLSGMGIMIALLMAAGYGLYTILWGQWKRIPYWLLSMVPPAVYELLYQSVR